MFLGFLLLIYIYIGSINSFYSNHKIKNKKIKFNSNKISNNLKNSLECTYQLKNNTSK